jgi:hypothetical protein
LVLCTSSPPYSHSHITQLCLLHSFLDITFMRRSWRQHQSFLRYRATKPTRRTEQKCYARFKTTPACRLGAVSQAPLDQFPRYPNLRYGICGFKCASRLYPVSCQSWCLPEPVSHNLLGQQTRPLRHEAKNHCHSSCHRGAVHLSVFVFFALYLDSCSRTIDVVSFLWLITGIYTSNSMDVGLFMGASAASAYPPPPPSYAGLKKHKPSIKGPSCMEHKLLAGIAFINWIQRTPQSLDCPTFADDFSVILYANTVMTVAIICHIRKQGVWLRPVTELPTFGAPALTFDSASDLEVESPLLLKTNDSEIFIHDVSSQAVDTRTPYHFRSRIPFTLSTNRLLLPSSHPPLQTETLSTAPSPSPPLPLPPLPSDSVVSLIPTVSTQSDLTPQNTDGYPRLNTDHCVALMGDPPTYSSPGLDYQLVAV